MRIAEKCVGLLLLLIQSASVPVGAYAATGLNDDLSFPASPEPFGYAKASKMFKPQGSGPFPALVMLPTCGGHLSAPCLRCVGEGCAATRVCSAGGRPLDATRRDGPGRELPGRRAKCSLWRLRKDALDAAAHLRKQPFVDPDRIGLLGLSQGAMAALGVSASLYETPQGQPAFRAIVANYPVCFLGNLRMPGRAPVNVNFVPEERITVPLLVQMGDLDTEGPPQDCISRLQVQKDKGAPVELVVYKNATHGWDIGNQLRQDSRERPACRVPVKSQGNCGVLSSAPSISSIDMCGRRTRSNSVCSRRAHSTLQEYSLNSRLAHAAWQRTGEAWCNRATLGYDVATKISQHRLASTAPGGKHERSRQTRHDILRHFHRVLRRRFRAATGDRRAAGSLQHAAGRQQRPAGAQRLSADHPSPGRPLDRLYRPSRRHRRGSGCRSTR